ncbi:hypothetical protein [Kibdelosporangium philippinense]|nr:hypothetical protein [Kibdelosporangium philippinense]
MTVPTFPSTTDPVRLQRVADLLQKYGEIPGRLDMVTMVLPPVA